MCCTPSKHHGMRMMESGSSCCCDAHGQRSMFWSKQKQVRMLQEKLARMKDEVKDLEDYITELQEEK